MSSSALGPGHRGHYGNSGQRRVSTKFGVVHLLQTRPSPRPDRLPLPVCCCFTVFAACTAATPSATSNSPPPIDIANDACIASVDDDAFEATPAPDLTDMIFIAGGQFDDHVVGDFYLDRTEVIVAAYRQCVDAHVCPAPDPFKNAYSNWRDEPGELELHPINFVNWYNADTYCRWKGLRLPSEWEWEWAARGRDEDRREPWGNERPTCERAVLRILDTCEPKGTALAGSKASGASRDGVLGLAGNVSEWTSSIDPQRTSWRAIRGYSFSTSGSGSATKRRYRNAAMPSDTIGFRCVASPERIG